MQLELGAGGALLPAADVQLDQRRQRRRLQTRGGGGGELVTALALVTPGGGGARLLRGQQAVDSGPRGGPAFVAERNVEKDERAELRGPSSDL